MISMGEGWYPSGLSDSMSIGTQSSARLRETIFSAFILGLNAAMYVLILMYDTKSL